jgi:hypothetical protein
MKKITIILNLSFLIFNSPKGFAQIVTIPDANFITLPKWFINKIN